MENYYKILGLPSTAAQREIRRAYRILARRYHPDLNPDLNTEEKFKKIAEAYKVLSNPQARAEYDISFRQFQQREIRKKFVSYSYKKKEEKPPQPSAEFKRSLQEQRKELKLALAKYFKLIPSLFKKASSYFLRIKNLLLNFLIPGKSSGTTVLELSLKPYEAIFGARKKIEINLAEKNSIKKILVKIPPLSYSGKILRIQPHSPFNLKELIVVLRVAYHPLVDIDRRGITIEIPITVEEAVSGAVIRVPAVEDTALLKVPPGIQSGTVLRVANAGPKREDGTPSDIFYKLMIYVPSSHTAVGLKDKVKDLSSYYGREVRDNLPLTLGEMLKKE